MGNNAIEWGQAVVGGTGRHSGQLVSPAALGLGWSGGLAQPPGVTVLSWPISRCSGQSGDQHPMRYGWLVRAGRGSTSGRQQMHPPWVRLQPNPTVTGCPRSTRTGAGCPSDHLPRSSDGSCGRRTAVADVAGGLRRASKQPATPVRPTANSPLTLAAQHEGATRRPTAATSATPPVDDLPNPRAKALLRSLLTTTDEVSGHCGHAWTKGVAMQVSAPFEYERATSIDHAIGLLEPSWQQVEADRRWAQPLADDEASTCQPRVPD